MLYLSLQGLFSKRISNLKIYSMTQNFPLEQLLIDVEYIVENLNDEDLKTKIKQLNNILVDKFQKGNIMERN